MNIHALTVCVDYATELALSIDRWLPGLASWTIVTNTTDEDTAELARSKGCRVHRTDVFYDNGAAFNKGAAMEEARKLMPWEDWILLLDADVIPPEGWLAQIDRVNPEVGYLHGAVRHECADPANLDPFAWPIPPHDSGPVGYFQLFHATDPAANPEGDLIDTFWLHAGNYDSCLIDRWRQAGGRDGDYRRMLNLHLCHIGERDNWWGKGNKLAFEAMQAERKKRGGWRHERIGGA